MVDAIIFNGVNLRSWWVTFVYGFFFEGHLLGVHGSRHGDASVRFAAKQQSFSKPPCP